MNKLTSAVLIALSSYGAGLATHSFLQDEAQNEILQSQTQRSEQAHTNALTSTAKATDLQQAKAALIAELIAQEDEQQSKEELQLELMTLKQQLAQSYLQQPMANHSGGHSVGEVKGEEEVTEADQDKKEGVIIKGYTNEQVAQMFNRQLDRVKEDLVSRLKLNPTQSTSVNALLQQKLDVMLDFMAQTAKGSLPDLTEEERSQRTKELYLQVTATHDTLTQQIASQLSNEQYNEYLRYEQEKAEINYRKQLITLEERVSRALPGLDDYQKTEINRQLMSTDPDLSQVAIASSGLPLKSEPRITDTELVTMLTGILSEEEIETLKAKLKQNRA